MSKEEKLALVKAGREDRGKYQARAAVKQKKVCVSICSRIFSRPLDIFVLWVDVTKVTTFKMNVWVHIAPRSMLILLIALFKK